MQTPVQIALTVLIAGTVAGAIGVAFRSDGPPSPPATDSPQNGLTSGSKHSRPRSNACAGRARGSKRGSRRSRSNAPRTSMRWMRPFTTRWLASRRSRCAIDPPRPAIRD